MASKRTWLVVSGLLEYTWYGDLYVLQSGRYDIMEPGVLPDPTDKNATPGTDAYRIHKNAVASHLLRKFGPESGALVPVRLEVEYLTDAVTPPPVEEAPKAPEPLPQPVKKPAKTKRGRR